MVVVLCLLLPPTLSVHLLQGPGFVTHLYVSYWLFSSKTLSLKAVGIQKQVLAGGLLSCAGQHHIQAQLAEGWVSAGTASQVC